MIKQDPDLLAKLAAVASRQRIARAAIARDDINTFIPFVLRDEETGNPIAQAPYHEDLQNLINDNPRVVAWGHVELGKALAIDTPIPTPDGWVTMADLSEGDLVFGDDGKPCMVTFATPVMHGRRCYEVKFNDGSSLIADEDHQWRTWTADRYSKRRPAQVVTTGEILRRGLTVGKSVAYRWRIPMPGVPQYPSKYALPVHPYVLGVWLGDGDSQGPQLTCHVDDVEIIDRCIDIEDGICGDRRWQSDTVLRQGIGVSIRHKFDPNALSKRLRAMGLINNKHIPEEYLIAPFEQRVALLQGLLDTDGTVSTQTENCIEFVQADEHLANQVAELARSLGQRVHVGGSDRKWRVTWRHQGQWNPFILARKAALITPCDPTVRLSVKSIVSITEVPSVPVRCISVDSPNSCYLAGEAYNVTHNTQQISIGRPLWELGRNPELRVVLVQATATQAKKAVRTVAEHIVKNKLLHLVFPNLRPGKGLPWNTEQLTVQRTPGIIQPSFQGVGAHGNILGARIDLLILDDILTQENTRTQSGREDIYNWIKSTLLGRMTKNGRVIFLGNAWHPEDAMHRLADEGWANARFPVRDQVTGETNWPHRWPNERILKKAEEFGPVEAARQLDCLARSDDAARFKREWIDKCLANGRGTVMPYKLAEIPPGCFTFTGVDLGVKKGLHNDYTVLFTVMVRPDGVVQVLYLEAGKWDAPDILRRVFDTHSRYKSRVLVEDNGGQDFLRQFAPMFNASVPIYPFNTRGTGKVGNKHHPQYGVEGIAAEMAQGRWVIPCDENLVPDPEIQAWIQEMLYYDPLSHTGDRLMASWFAREGGRRRFTHRMAVAQIEEVSSYYELEQKRKSIGIYSHLPDSRAAVVRQMWDELDY